jgi:hypothetical protein
VKCLLRLALIVATAMTSLFLANGCDQSKGAPVNQLRKLAEDNACFYKGGYGIVCEGVYLRESDNKNNLYSSSKVLLAGDKKGVDQLVYIKTPTSPEPELVTMEITELPTEGILVLFRKNYVYVLNFSSKQYCKYRR